MPFHLAVATALSFQFLGHSQHQALQDLLSHFLPRFWSSQSLPLFPSIRGGSCFLQLFFLGYFKIPFLLIQPSSICIVTPGFPDCVWLSQHQEWVPGNKNSGVGLAMSLAWNALLSSLSMRNGILVLYHFIIILSQLIKLSPVVDCDELIIKGLKFLRGPNSADLSHMVVKRNMMWDGCFWI